MISGAFAYTGMIAFLGCKSTSKTQMLTAAVCRASKQDTLPAARASVAFVYCGAHCMLLLDLHGAGAQGYGTFFTCLLNAYKDPHPPGS